MKFYCRTTSSVPPLLWYHCAPARFPRNIPFLRWKQSAPSVRATTSTQASSFGLPPKRNVTRTPLAGSGWGRRSWGLPVRRGARSRAAFCRGSGARSSSADWSCQPRRSGRAPKTLVAPPPLWACHWGVIQPLLVVASLQPVALAPVRVRSRGYAWHSGRGEGGAISQVPCTMRTTAGWASPEALAATGDWAPRPAWGPGAGAASRPRPVRRCWW